MSKKYPFSMARNAHHLERAYNHLFREYIYPDNVSPEKKAWAQDMRNKIAHILSTFHDGKIAYLTGPEIGFAKDIVAWAEDFRDMRMQMTWEEINAG